MFPKMKEKGQEKPENDRLRAAEEQQGHDRSKPVEKQTGNDRLKAVKKHPDYPDLLNIRPSSAYLYGRYMFQIIFGLIFTAVALFFLSRSPLESDFIFDIVSLIFIVVGIGIIGYGIYRTIRLISGNVHKLPALIVDKRISIKGGGQSSSSKTTYFVTLELDDMGRRELKARGKLYGKITREDAGVAYIHDRYLLDFKRLAI